MVTSISNSLSPILWVALGGITFSTFRLAAVLVSSADPKEKPKPKKEKPPPTPTTEGGSTEVQPAAVTDAISAVVPPQTRFQFSQYTCLLMKSQAVSILFIVTLVLFYMNKGDELKEDEMLNSLIAPFAFLGLGSSFFNICTEYIIKKRLPYDKELAKISRRSYADAITSLLSS